MIAENKEATRNDGPMADILGMGSNQRIRYNASVGIALGTALPQDILEGYYLNGFGKIIVDKPAEEMTRAGIDLEDIDLDQKEKVMARIEELDILHYMAEALKSSRYSGGAVVVLGIVDGVGQMNLPVREESITGLSFVRVYDRYQVRVASHYKDSQKAEFGNPEIYEITPRGMQTYSVHASRVLVFDGEFVPPSFRDNNDGWGLSVLQKCYVELEDFIKSHHNASGLLQRSRQAVHKMKGLANKLGEEGDTGKQEIQSRIALVDASANMYNSVAIDAEEEYTVTNSSMSGVNDILDRKAENLSAVCDVPVFLLFGRSPGGLNATGEANKEGWNAKVGAMQKDILFNPLDRIVTILMREIKASDAQIKNYKLKFAPLSVPSAKDQAETELKKAQTELAEMQKYQGYVNMAAMDPQEVRKNIAEREEIDPDEVPDLPEPATPAQTANNKKVAK